MISKNQMAQERSGSRTQNIKSVPPNKLELDPLKFKVWDFSEQKTCKIKLASKSMADLSGLAVKYRIHYFADGYRSDPVHTSSESRIHLLKGREPHEFETVPVELKCIETQRLDKNRIPQGPVLRSSGAIKGLSLVIIHNGKVVHQYVSSGVKPEDAIKE